MPGAPEPPLYRPYAVLALASAVAGGVPLGLWMLAWLYLGAPAVPVQWMLLHAHLQTFGFFGTLIAGVAQHLLPRFTGRPVVRHPASPALAALLGGALGLRVGATWAEAPAVVLAASILQAAGFALFAAWVWRALDPPPLAPLRRHLAASSAWLALGLVLEAALRARALVAGAGGPEPGGMAAVHAIGVLGGVVGWVVGVLVRAGPMFVPDWRVPPALSRALATLLALGVVVTAAGEAGGWEARTGAGVARLGEAVALGAAAAALLAGGALRRARGALPMLSRGPQESRLFRLAAASLLAAAGGAAATAAVAWTGAPVRVLADAVRHLVTIGFLTSMVVAMAFRLIPALERQPLPWPGLRAPAFWALAIAVAARTGEVVVAYALPALAPLVALSGILVWLAVTAVAANLTGVLVRRPRA